MGAHSKTLSYMPSLLVMRFDVFWHHTCKIHKIQNMAYVQISWSKSHITWHHHLGFTLEATIMRGGHHISALNLYLHPPHSHSPKAPKSLVLIRFNNGLKSLIDNILYLPSQLLTFQLSLQFRGKKQATSHFKGKKKLGHSEITNILFYRLPRTFPKNVPSLVGQVMNRIH